MKKLLFFFLLCSVLFAQNEPIRRIEFADSTMKKLNITSFASYFDTRFNGYISNYYSKHLADSLLALKQNSIGYAGQIYTVLLTQNSTTPPSAVILGNTMALGISLSYVSAGKYKLSRTGGFDSTKTLIMPNLRTSFYLSPNYIMLSWDTDKNLLIQTWGPDLSLTDSILKSFALKIEIYN